MTTPDPQYLKNDQYKNAARLSARARLHSRYSRNPQGWFNWMFELYDLPPDARILELGAGAGWLWLSNRERIPPGWNITLSDFSGGMLDEQRRTLAKVSHSFAFREIDAQAIPYPDASFDGVIANNMLYHVPDRAQAIAEMRRVLKPGGSALHRHQWRAAFAGNPPVDVALRLSAAGMADGFVSVRGYTLENAPEQLRAQFAQVEVRRYDDVIELSEPEPLVDYILSFPLQLSDERIAELRASRAGRNRAAGHDDDHQRHGRGDCAGQFIRY